MAVSSPDLNVPDTPFNTCFLSEIWKTFENYLLYSFCK